MNPLRFSTKFQDDETGLLYYGYRYYCASMGRWLSRDPVEENGTVNIYTFVRNDPLQKIDPTGLFVVLLTGCSRDPCSDPCGTLMKDPVVVKLKPNGFVACCNGKRVVCVVKAGSAAGDGSTKKAQGIIKNCVREHEETHFPWVDCPATGLKIAEFKPGLDPNVGECVAYFVQLVCLVRHRAECGGDPQCLQDMQLEIMRIDNQRREKCAAPRLEL